MCAELQIVILLLIRQVILVSKSINQRSELCDGTVCILAPGDLPQTRRISKALQTKPVKAALWLQPHLSPSVMCVLYHGCYVFFFL